MLCILSPPVTAEPAQPDRHGEVAKVRRAANQDELTRYAQRERSAKKQEKFEGGRGYYLEASTVIIVLLVVILVLILI